MPRLKDAMKRQLRDVQTYAPWLIDAKFAFYNAGTRYAGLFVDPEFTLLSRLPAAGLALDIGGNRGQSILALKRHARPRRIVTFEPNPVLVRGLEERFGTLESVTIKPVGLGEKPDRLDLYVLSYRNFTYDGLASLNETEALAFFNDRMIARYDERHVSLTRCRVEVRTLDSFEFEPDIIKMDVQGLEDAVLAGGLETVQRCRPVMIIEAPSARFTEMAASAGLSPYRYDGHRLVRGSTGAKNIVYLSEAHLEALGEAL